jgi:hypothetical protein
MNQNKFNHYLSLIFSFVAILVDFVKFDGSIEAGILTMMVALIIVIGIYYVAARIGILLIESIIKLGRKIIK